MDNKKILERENNFWHLHNELINIGTTYLSLLVFDEYNNVIFSKSSDYDWAEEFTSTGLYKNCHLLNEAHSQMEILKNKRFTIAWDLYTPETDESKSLEEIRKQKNISHGVGFGISNNQIKLLLNVAGKYSDINFGLNLLKKKKAIYEDLNKFMLQEPSYSLSRLLLTKTGK